MTINGKRLQLTGERAETKVRDALLDAELFCSKYEHDRGEDLLIELEGYISQTDTSSGPRIGLLQVRGHEAEAASASDVGTTKRRIKLNHLRRWAAIPLPVFIIAVELVGTTAQFFSLNADVLINDIAPEGLAALEQKTITVSLPRVENLAAFLKIEILQFYALNAFNLSTLSENVIARSHYELISSSTPFLPPQAKVWMKNIRILWKGPWRPAHFWATLNHIADQLGKTDGGRVVPLKATIHVYRSLKDNRDNNAIAHVSWIEDDHPSTEDIKKLIDWPKTAHWARFRFNSVSAISALPESHIQEIDDEEFLEKAEIIWSKLDTFYKELESLLTSELRVSDNDYNRIDKALSDFEKNIIDKLGRPSLQFRILDRMIDQYILALFGVLTWLKGKDNVSEITRKRWLKQDLELAEGHYRSFNPLAKLLRNG